MTEPGGFEYSNDSVVARMSIDVPPQALTDLDQIRQQAAGLRTEMEALARAESNWVDYLNAIPGIADRADQSYRNLITSMERMSYVQREMGGGLPGAGGDFTGASGGSGGHTGYSTAAPAGHVDPFAGMHAGMGERSFTPEAAVAQAAHIQSTDPRLAANMAAARGINPAMLGAMGGVAAEVLGAGSFGGGSGHGESMSSKSTQTTQTARDSSAPPSQEEGGAPTTSASQHTPSEPHPDASWMEKAMSAAIGGSLFNEMSDAFKGGGGISGMAGSVLGGAAMTGKLGKLGKLGKGLVGTPLGKGLMGVGAGLWAANKVQDLGEAAQEYRNWGSVQGGGFGEGVGYELRSRFAALDPFVNTQQTREMMQASLSEGFRGDDLNTMRDFMMQNTKKFNMDSSETMQIYNSAVLKGKDDTESFAESIAKLGNSLNLMKDLAAEGGASLPERKAQFAQMAGALTSHGVSQDIASGAALRAQEMYADDKVLRDHVPGATAAASGNDLAAMALARKYGIRGALPETVDAELSDRGIDAQAGREELYKELAERAQRSNPGNPRNAAAYWGRMMKQMYGVDTGDFATTFRWYQKLTGAKDPGDQARERISSAAAPTPTGGPGGNPMGGLAGDVLGARSMSDLGNIPRNFMNRAAGIDPSTQNQAAIEAMKPSLQPAPTSGPALGGGSLTTQGTVTGTVRIQVDQAGRVTAPPSIQLTGTQRAANMGWGSSQLNNPSPGEGFAHSGWAGG